ncbi:hypothetical protein BG004_000415 [Podila humilis]|nr:hypothetical protein BG004_000415 [Podila humilis]
MNPTLLEDSDADGMEIDQDIYSQDISISSSLPTSLFQTPRATGSRRVLTPDAESPTVEHTQMELPPKPRKLLEVEQWIRDNDNDLTATPSKSSGIACMLGDSDVNESSPTPEGGGSSSLLGKHPHSSSPVSAEIRLRSKGPNNYTNFPKPPKFSLAESLGVSKGKHALFCPIPKPAFFATPVVSDLVTPESVTSPPAPPFGFDSFLQASSSRRSSIESNDSENPFLGSSKPKLNFALDYLSESQWYSDYPHHITKEYLDELFQLDKRVMFTSIKSGWRDYPDYLTTNYFVNKGSLGQGDFADVLKVQSKSNKEFYAVKKLRKKVKGAYER